MSEAIAVSLPGGKKMKVPRGTAPGQIAENLSASLFRESIAAIVDGEVVDLDRAIKNDCEMRILTAKDPKGLEVVRHTAAHLLAQAIQIMRPDARLTIGPVVEDAFYYDVEDGTPYTPEDLIELEGVMGRLAKEGARLVRRELTREEARALFKDNKFKLEMIDELPGDALITIYEQGGGFYDLCRGPHVRDLSQIKAFKILKVAGTHWRGDIRREPLQRIYGTAFPSKKELDDYLFMLEEAKKRDHRRIGSQMDLFSFHQEGPGFPFWHPQGMTLFSTVVAHWTEIHERYSYEFIRTPMVLDDSLWHRSGHYENYKANMYFTDINGQGYAIKPMNCPGGLLVYKARKRSYRDLPVKHAELGLVHRHEMSGVLHGLFRVRAFTQDDAHVYCTPEQLEHEIVDIMNLVAEIYESFGFHDYSVELSTRPEKRIGSDATWDETEAALESALQAQGVEYVTNEGDGAFYGPKIDYHIRDSMNRFWQCGTIQVDLSMPSPERLDATYEGADGRPHTPVMIHRAILGSLERFIGILIEHYAGSFPLWLSPEQVRVLPVTSKADDYAREIAQDLASDGIRATTDLRNERVQKKIRAASIEHVNYQLVVGEREMDAGTVSVRTRNGDQLGTMSVAEFRDRALERIAAKTNEEEV